MITFWKYLQDYLWYLMLGKYKWGFGFSAVVLFTAFFPFPFLVRRYTWFGHDLTQFRLIAEAAEYWPFMSLWAIIPGFVVALVWAVWFGFKVLNDHMEKRDAEDLKRSPEARLDRAYRLLNELIQEGDSLIKGGAHPETIEKWDERVQSVIADWCDIGAVQVYMGNSRKRTQVKLEDPSGALNQLAYIHRNLAQFLK